jgi:hypothetical protein
MKRLGLLLGGALLFAATVALISEAWAACPPGTRYNCVQGYGGKVICSCS